MVYIPAGEKREFEKVKIDEWVLGEIEDIQEFKDVEKAFTNEEGEKELRKINQVRFKFKLEGCEYPHYSRKMTASMSERSNLYKFLSQLYGAQLAHDVPVELDKLKGVKLKMMWDEVELKDGTMFQFPDKIRPNQDDLPAIWMIDEKPKEDSPF